MMVSLFFFQNNAIMSHCHRYRYLPFLRYLGVEDERRVAVLPPINHSLYACVLLWKRRRPWMHWVE